MLLQKLKKRAIFDMNTLYIILAIIAALAIYLAFNAMSGKVSLI